jgi:DedD protein
MFSFMATRQSARSRVRGGSSADASSDATLPQKKRARQRLIGALALCAVAAIVAPLVFAPEPSRTSSELDLLMPSRQLPGSAGQAAKEAVSQDIGIVESGGTAKAIAALDAEVGAPVDPARSEGEVASGATPADVVEPHSGSKVSASETPSPAPVVPSQMTDRPSGPPVATRAMESPSTPERAPASSESMRPRAASVERPEAKASSARPRPSELTRGRHAVQVGAYATESVAKAAVERVQAMGLRAFTERIKTERGERIRVRVGPYASREAAEVARSKLKSSGIEAAIIAP